MYAIKVLFVEDDLKLQDIVLRYLQREGYEVDVAGTVEEGLDFLAYQTYHVAIVDIMLPDGEGWSVLKALKSETETPAIMLTALGEEGDKLHGFDLGADDYVTKPFSAKELIARVKIQLRHHMPSQRPMVTSGLLTIDPTLRSVAVGGKTLALTGLEYDLLLYFVDNVDIALSRQQLLDEVWGFDYDGDSRTVDTHVKRLRQKLEGCGACIGTVRGYGYKWEVNANASINRQ